MTLIDGINALAAAVRDKLNTKAPLAHVHGWTGVTLNLPAGAGVVDATQTVADAGVTAASTIELKLAATTADDENEAETISLDSLAADPASGSFDIIAAFRERHAGPIKLQYRIS